VVREDYFLTDSVVRPLVADNLALGRRWYDNFAALLCDEAAAQRLTYRDERKGLQTMANDRDFLDADELQFVRAIHRAIFLARGKIYADTLGEAAARRREPANPAVRNRWKKLSQDLRLDLIGAKTAAQVQGKVNELLARCGTIREIRDEKGLSCVYRLLFGADWQRVRSLALFALASYKRPPQLTALPGDDEDTDEAPPST
jgi:CRISPR-associated protein Cas8a1/Csx13